MPPSIDLDETMAVFKISLNDYSYFSMSVSFLFALGIFIVELIYVNSRKNKLLEMSTKLRAKLLKVKRDVLLTCCTLSYSTKLSSARTFMSEYVPSSPSFLQTVSGPSIG